MGPSAGGRHRLPACRTERFFKKPTPQNHLSGIFSEGSDRFDGRKFRKTSGIPLKSDGPPRMAASSPACLPRAALPAPRARSAKRSPKTSASSPAAQPPASPVCARGELGHPDDFARGADPALATSESLVSEIRANPAAFTDARALVHHWPTNRPARPPHRAPPQNFSPPHCAYLTPSRRSRPGNFGDA